MRASVIALIAVLFAGCGGDSNPSRPTPVLTDVTITVPGSGVLFLGETYTLTMSARMSDGSMITSGGTWTSDAPTVATINSSSGALQVVGLGEATISVAYQGQRGTQRIRSTVKYEGTLRTTSRVTGCLATEDWAAVDACTEFPVGYEAPIDGTFTQTDRTVTAIMSLEEGDPSTPATAQVGDNGELRFETVTAERDLTMTVQWTLAPSGVTQIGGSHVMRIVFVGVAGHLDVSATVLPSGIARLAGSAAPVRRSYEDAIARAVRRLRP